MERDITKSSSPMQTLNEICTEYNCSEPKYDVSFPNSKKPFITKGIITKEEKTYFFLGES